MRRSGSGGEEDIASEDLEESAIWKEKKAKEEEREPSKKVVGYEVVCRLHCFVLCVALLSLCGGREMKGL